MKVITKMVVAASAASLLALAGCNTIKGAGQDVSAVGNATTNAAKDTSKKIDKETGPSQPTKK